MEPGHVDPLRGAPKGIASPNGHPTTQIHFYLRELIGVPLLRLDLPTMASILFPCFSFKTTKSGGTNFQKKTSHPHDRRHPLMILDVSHLHDIICIRKSTPPKKKSSHEEAPWRHGAKRCEPKAPAICIAIAISAQAFGTDPRSPDRRSPKNFERQEA